MAALLMSTQYTPLHSEYYRCAQPPQPPPSPPMEDSRCSLPSISKLLGLADAGSPTSETSASSQLGSPRTEGAGSSSQPPRQETPYACTDSRPSSSYSKHSHQRGMPPTPPMGTDPSFDGYNSPSSKPIGQFASAAPGRFYETTPPLDDDVRRQHHMMPSRAPRPCAPTSCSRQSFSTNSFSTLPQMGNYYQSPLHAATSSHTQISNLYYQHPLPQTFPPLSVPVVLAPSSGANPWQHHHYLTPNHGAPFPQNQDRYICQTCNKAFSRPSSLRIHSHSHTGEKPFKCPHAGCGKAFSVRSNMKRHERGCHSFEVGAGRSTSAS
ncbi:Zinc finger protein C25B8.19c [Tolypocladium paradoxum]|uniref:Zinc finger protein C25B8.19c n=1 Tax=Tolypocladium paradoxum TaxID=94208 RepID=A0A2S4L7G8_9HYPO|nr:Zinc finger protein C25B8.19c [Tolypocladium paradoxum]